MIIQGGRTMSECADCGRAPVSYDGGLCAYCQSIRTVDDGKTINMRPYVLAFLTAWAIGMLFLAKYFVRLI